MFDISTTLKRYRSSILTSPAKKKYFQEIWIVSSSFRKLVEKSTTVDPRLSEPIGAEEFRSD